MTTVTDEGRRRREGASRIHGGLGSIESIETRQALARPLDFEGMAAIRSRSADCQTELRHGTASQPVADREALIRYIDWLTVSRLPALLAAVEALQGLMRSEHELFCDCDRHKAAVAALAPFTEEPTDGRD